MRHALHPALLAAVLGILAVLACGEPDPSQQDAGPEEDAGLTPAVDAGPRDAGQKVDGGVVDAGFAPFGVELWCQHLALARCARAQSCLSLDEAQLDRCMTRERASCDQAAYTSAVKGGRLQYLPEEAARCVNAYATVGCTAHPAECEPVFAGLVPPDGGCLLEEECQLGSYCLVSAYTCPGRCYAYRAVGEPCDWSQRQCDPDTGRCADTDGGRECLARRGPGEPCEYSNDCRLGLACGGKMCVQAEAKVGEACRLVQSYPYCEKDAFCRLPPVPQGQQPDGGVCARKAGLGGVCSGWGSCLTGLRCSSNYETGTCIPLGGVNETCTNYDDCQQELYCSPPTSRCLELPGAGGDCGSQGSSFRCRAGHYCDWQSYRCEALKTEGQPCSYYDQCESGSCEYGLLPDGGSARLCVDACVVRLDGGF